MIFSSSSSEVYPKKPLNSRAYFSCIQYAFILQDISSLTQEILTSWVYCLKSKVVIVTGDKTSQIEILVSLSFDIPVVFVSRSV